MYKIARLNMIIKNQIKDNPIELVEELLAMLYKNGQILNDYIVEKHEGYYIASVTTSDNDSLEDKYFNGYIQKALEKIEFTY